MELQDSGERRMFKSGAVRDVATGKGRCDLLPLEVIAEWWLDNVLERIGQYVRNGKVNSLYGALNIFISKHYPDIYTATLEVAKHFEAGAIKYNDRNWELGIPLSCYTDSAVRHYLQFRRGDIDEPHDRAFMWNILCAIWTHRNKPEMIDLPFARIKVRNGVD